MGFKPNWGAGLSALGRDLGYMAQQQRQDRLMAQQRQQQLDDLAAQRTYQEGRDTLAFNRGQTAADAASDRVLGRQQDYLDYRDPLLQIPYGRVMGIDLSKAYGPLGSIPGARKSDAMSVLRDQINNKARADRAPAGKATKVPTLTDKMMLDAAVTPDAELVATGGSGDLRSATSRLYGQMVAAGYPKSQITMDAAAEAAMGSVGGVPNFGYGAGSRDASTAYDPVSGTIYDPNIAQPQKQGKKHWPDWAPWAPSGLNDPSFEPALGRTQADLEAYPPEPASQYYMEVVKPVLDAGHVNPAKITEWGNKLGIPETAVQSWLKGQAQAVQKEPEPQVVAHEQVDGVWYDGLVGDDGKLVWKPSDDQTSGGK